MLSQLMPSSQLEHCGSEVTHTNVLNSCSVKLNLNRYCLLKRANTFSYFAISRILLVSNMIIYYEIA